METFIQVLAFILLLGGIYAVAQSMTNYNYVWNLKRAKKKLLESGVEYDLRDLAQMNEKIIGVRNYARLMFFIALVFGLLAAYFAMI